MDESLHALFYGIILRFFGSFWMKRWKTSVSLSQTSTGASWIPRPLHHKFRLNLQHMY